MATLLSSAPVKSDSKVRRDKTYRVDIWDDGTASCECMDYKMRGLRGALKERFQCRHIRSEIERLGIDWSKPPKQSKRQPKRGKAEPERPRFAVPASTIRRVSSRPVRDLTP